MVDVEGGSAADREILQPLEPVALLEDLDLELLAGGIPPADLPTRSPSRASNDGAGHPVLWKNSSGERVGDVSLAHTARQIKI